MREKLGDMIWAFWTVYLGEDVAAAIIFGLILLYILIIILVVIHPPSINGKSGRKRRRVEAPSNPYRCRK